MANEATHVAQGWEPEAIWLEDERVVVTRCHGCGQEIRLKTPFKPSALALTLASKIVCESCEGGESE
jgi:hypothetical protein